LKERSRGEDIWFGAKVALQSSPKAHMLKGLADLVPEEDGSRVADAITAAREIADNPATLAVIGHSTSATTRPAAEIYESAGIPLIMPIATSPLACIATAHSDWGSVARLQNCIQLLPRDDKYQAPALAFFARNVLKTERCILLRDESKETDDYSVPLFDTIEAYLLPENTIKLNISQIESQVRSAKAENPDLIVFCGYGTNAIQMFDRLRSVYGTGVARPRILLTDGTVIPDLNPEGFETFVTFPAPPLEHIRLRGKKTSSFDTRTLIASIEECGRDPSYQGYSYDAILMIADAVENITSAGLALSRHAVRWSLMQVDTFVGSMGSYTLSQGENRNAPYYVYACNVDSESRQLTYAHHATISQEDIMFQANTIKDR
jgi:ABC-type branched-subunit amino acid transport system substrate-binding protein